MGCVLGSLVLVCAWFLYGLLSEYAASWLWRSQMLDNLLEPELCQSLKEKSARSDYATGGRR